MNVIFASMLILLSCRVVVQALELVHNDGVKFRVVVVDARPHLAGQTTLRRLVKAGIECTYVLLSSLSYIMRSVTKVFLGAFNLLSNGALTNRVGTAMVAMVAHAAHVPVLVCCETYKFSERIQADSMVWNELGVCACIGMLIV